MENLPLKQTEPQPARIAEIVMAGARRLVAVGIESARLDAELLLGCALKMTREQLLAAAPRELSRDQRERYEALLLRRLRREPLAYVTGKQEFWSLDFVVSKAVLVPRPETELLVEIAVKHAAESSRGDRLRILDLGTGSGAIAVALAKELPEAEILATDISPEALAVARHNAAANGVSTRIRFYQGDLFAAIHHRIDREFNLIVSNPPYVCRAELSKLEPEVSGWEPRAALDGGCDGLDFYRRIAEEGPRYLRPGGALAVEIGAGTGAAVLALFKRAAAYTEEQIYRDYSGNERVFLASKRIVAMSLN